MLNDFRFAFRQLRKNPGFTAVAVLTLALGIGANTAIFSVINAVMLRSLPVKEPGELVQVVVAGVESRDYSFSYPQYERLQAAGRSLSGLFAAGGVGQSRMIASGIGGTETEFVREQPVTGNFFSVLGVQPFAGRLFSSADDQRGHAEQVVVISHGFWQRRFGGDPGVVGRTITFSEVPVTVVGVTPPGFFGFQPGENPDLWWPLQMMALVDRDPAAPRLGEGNAWLRLIGRVPRGTDPRQAQAHLAVAYEQHRAERAPARESKLNAGERRRVLDQKLELKSAASGWTDVRDKFRRALLILTVIVVLVLLIACANVAGLLLARAAVRTREFSIRSAMGADRARLVRQLLTESVLLAGLGGFLGLIFAGWGARLVVSYGIQSSLSFDLTPDLRVLCFTTGLSLLTGLAFGLVPALRGSRSDLASTMKSGASSIAGNPSRHFLQQSLVVVQVAVSLVLLVSAGLFIRTLQQLKGIDTGFNRDGVILFDLVFGQRVDTARRAQAYKQVLARLEETPGVRAASTSFITPLSGNGWGQRLNIEGYQADPTEPVRCNGMSVAPRYFETMGTPIVIGRDFGPQDDRLDGSSPTNAPAVAIINETLARRYFEKASPLGRRFSFPGWPDRKVEIIGVVKDAKYRSLREPVPATFYVSCFQELRNWDMTFAVRMAGKSAGMISAIRHAVRQTDPTLQLRDVRTMEEALDASIHQERIIADAGGFFSLTALVLACLGLYGTLSFTVAQRTREIGVRMALGAQRRDVLSLVVAKGLQLVLIGSVLGLGAALAAMRLVSRLLYGVTPTDPVTFVAVCLILLLVALFASWLPARRASRVDPMEALRYE